MRNKNSYEILGITKELIKLTYEKKSRGLENQNKVIKKAFDNCMKALELAEKYNNTPQKLEEIQKKREMCVAAYYNINTPVKRAFYNMKLNMQNKENNQMIDSIYNFFGISEEELNQQYERKKDKLIKKQYDLLKEEFEKVLTYPKNTPDERRKVEMFLYEIDRNYRRIENEDKRNSYNRTLEKMKDEKKERDIESVYKHAPNPLLIKTIETGKLRGKKMVIRRSAKRPVTIHLNDRNNTIITKTGEVQYRNCTGKYDSYVNEYQIAQIIRGEKIVHTIYTNLSILDLEVDKETGEPLNKKYYDAVTNKLLSEDLIKGSEYNGGYIGLLEKDDNDEYNTTLGKRKLSVDEHEMLAAVMIVKEREKMMKDRKNKKDERKEGDVR